MSVRTNRVENSGVSRWRLIAVLAWCVSCVWASPGAAGSPGDRVFAGANAELMVQIDDLAAQLRTPAGVSLRRALGDLGAFGRTREAWEALASTLGMDATTASDRLLGGRVLILGDGLSGDSPRWACVMSVDRETAKDAPRRLGGAPRATLDGRTVYAIEDGRFRVAVGDFRQGHTTIAISPVGCEALLRTAIGLGERWGGQGKRENGSGGGGVGGVIAVLVYRPAPGAWLSGTVEPALQGWRLRFSGTDQLGGPGALDGVSGIPEARFESVSSDAVFAVAGPASFYRATPDEGSLSWRSPEMLIWSMLPFDPPTGEFASSADFGVVAVRGVGQGRLDCSVALRVGKVGMLPLGDEYACGIVETFASGRARGVRGCRDERTTGRRDRTVMVQDGARRSAYGDQLAFSWGSSGPGTMGETWWSLDISGEGATRDAAGELARRGEAPGATRAMAGVIRPAEILSVLGGVNPEAGPLPEGAGGVSGLRWIERVRWHVDPSRAAGASWEGEIEVRMTPAP